MNSQTDIESICKKVRRNIVQMVFDAKSGHIGGSMSSVEIMSVLYSEFLSHRPDDPGWAERDRFIMSKGHATPVQYAILSQFGYIPEEELKSFRQLGTRLQGHSVIGKPPGVENSAGSLGMGLSFGLGQRIGLQLKGINSHVYVLMGDGEHNEGQVWEAVMAASHHKVTNLVALIDRNGIQNDDFTSSTMDAGSLAEKYEAFGWSAKSFVNGHDVADVKSALAWATEASANGPAVVQFDTVKGKGVSFMENNPSFHGAPPNEEEFKLAMSELG